MVRFWENLAGSKRRTRSSGAPVSAQRVARVPSLARANAYGPSTTTPARTGTDGAAATWVRQRICPACKSEHFPRTDPVAIMLATHGERCLLGRQAGWTPGMWSCLAGFIEPGESLEEGCARELLEESGLTATSVRYHSSQPWPFPSQLMVGFIAEVAEGEATPDQTELEAVRCPVLVLHGQHDHTAPVGCAAKIAARTRAVRTRILPLSYHLIAADVERDIVAAEVIDFMRRNVRAKTGEVSCAM